MSNMAEYARIFETGTDDDWVQKRKAAAEDIVRWYESLSTASAIETASAIASTIADGKPLPDQIASPNETTLQSHAPSFVRSAEAGELQIKVVMMAAAIDLVEKTPCAHGWNVADALAASFWSAIWFQSPLVETKIENLRSDLLRASRTRVLNVARSARQRRAVPRIPPVNIAQDSSPGQKVNQAFAKAVGPLLEVLQGNAALDREELDFTWWLLADRSDILDKPLSKFSNGSRAVVAGLDAAKKLRQLPSESHRHIVLRNIVDDQPVSLSEILTELGNDRTALARAFAFPVDNAGAVFPLLSGMMSGASEAPFAAEKYLPTEWGAHALLEGAIQHMEAESVSGR